MKRKNEWTKEFYQSVVDWMKDENKTIEQAKEHFGFGSNTYYKYRAIFKDQTTTKRPYNKKAKPAFIDFETTKTSDDQVAVILVSTSKLKAVMGALWQS